MDASTQTSILRRVRRKPGGVYTPKDFLDLAGRDAVDQALGRLVASGDLIRLGRGLYHAPRVSKRLGTAVPPDADDVARAIGRRTNSRVVPSPARLVNRFGLSTQVSAKPVYLTDGPTRTVKVGNRSFHMRHVARKRLPAGDDPSDLALLAIRSVGPDGLDDAAVGRLRRALTPAQRRRLARSARYTDAWVADAARKIAADA